MTTVFPDFLTDLLTQGTHSHSLPPFGMWRMAYDRHLALALTLTVSSSLKGWVSPPQLPLMSALRIEFLTQSVSHP